MFTGNGFRSVKSSKMVYRLDAIDDYVLELVAFNRGRLHICTKHIVDSLNVEVYCGCVQWLTVAL